MKTRRNSISQRVEIDGGAGFRLSGVLEKPQGEVQSYGLFGPCFTCPKNAKAIVGISRLLADRGIAVLRYDVTGSGESRGRFEDTSFSTQVDDMVAAARWLEDHAKAPELVIGMSLGGAVALVATPLMASVEAVVTLNAPATTQRLRDLLLTLAPEIMVEGSAEVTLLGSTTRVGRVMVDDLGRFSVERAATVLRKPLLILQSTHDETVEPVHGDRLLAAARPPRSLVAIPGGDHLLLDGTDLATFAGEIIVSWFLQTLRISRD